jgi:AcrR family transcriptional regulator
MPFTTKEAILDLLINRAPNAVRERTIFKYLSRYADETVRNAMQELVAEGAIQIAHHVERNTGAELRLYTLSSYQNVPIRRFVRVGDIEVPRLIGAEPMSAFLDDYNEAIESLANYSVTLEERFSQLVEDKLRGYWANIITIFGVFVAVLGFILVGFPKITIDPSLSLWRTFLLNAAQILPLAIVLAIFVCVLHWVIRKS